MASKKAIPWFKVPSNFDTYDNFRFIFFKHGGEGVGNMMMLLIFLSRQENFKCDEKKFHEFAEKAFNISDEIYEYLLKESGMFKVSAKGIVSSEWLNESVNEYVNKSNGGRNKKVTSSQDVTQDDTQHVGQDAGYHVTQDVRQKKEERSKNREEREESIKHSIDLNTSNQEKKEKEKKEVSSQAADSAPIHVVAQHGAKSRKKKLNLKREGFFIQGVKSGEPYELEVTDVKQPEIVEWLQKNLGSFIAQQEDWLTKDHIWKLWKAFFEKEKVGYSNDWAGLHTHFCNCIKKARRSEFTTGYQQPSKPQKHVKPELKPNRPPEGYFDQTLPIDNPRDADAIVAYMIEQEAIEKAQQEALKNKQNG